MFKSKNSTIIVFKYVSAYFKAVCSRNNKNNAKSSIVNEYILGIAKVDVLPTT